MKSSIDMVSKINHPLMKRRGKEGAQGMVEFAMVLPILLLLLFGIFEFGRMLFVYSVVFTSSREAARYGSAAGYVGNVPRYADCAGIRAAAARLGILAGIDPSRDVTIRYNSVVDPQVPATNVASYPSCPPGSIKGGLHRIIVEVKAAYKPILPLFNLGSFYITSRSARTILSQIDLGVAGIVPPTPTQPPPTATTAPSFMSVGAIAGCSRPQGPSNWRAYATVTIIDNLGNPVADVRVNGSFGFCNRTDASGKCTINSGNISNSTPSVSFEVTSLSGGSLTYNPSGNNPNPPIINIARSSSCP